MQADSCDTKDSTCALHIYIYICLHISMFVCVYTSPDFGLRLMRWLGFLVEGFPLGHWGRAFRLSASRQEEHAAPGHVCRIHD